MEPLTADDPVYVGGFRLRARLGAGGMGRVYLGTSAGGRAVAVKVVRPELARDTEFIRRFRHEVAAAQQVSGAFTAPVIAADLDASPPWLATAFVPGPSLQDWVDVWGPLPEPAVRRLAAGLAEALSAVHASGLVHRDLKPSNVLLAEDGPRVIDFGISRARYSTAVTVPGYVVGTPPFMSPEQAKGHPVGPASDIFSLGAVLCLAATGRPPFGDDDSVVVLYRIAHEPPAIDAIPVPLRGLIARCLTKDPAGRPGLAELMRALADGVADSRVAAMSFWPREVAQRVTDYRARMVEGTPEPRVAAQPMPPARGGLATQTGSAFAAQTTPPARAESAGQTAPIPRPRRGRRELVAGGAVALVAAAGVLLAALWPSSPQHRSSDPPATHAATTTAPADDIPMPACGPTCFALYSPSFGGAEVLAAVGSEQNVGQAVELQAPDGNSGRDDWVSSFAGTVHSFYLAGLVSAAINRNYGSDEAYEYEYVPYGVDSGLCLGVAGTAHNGTQVTLQACGVSARTVWVSNTAKKDAQQVSLINGTSSVTDPFVLTANGANASPTTRPFFLLFGTAPKSQDWSTEP
jgi:eukaryotic-like serine/threonine-protein kinase